MILDGRNRYRACIGAKVVMRFEELADGADPVRFVIDHNLRRRHLTDDQRRMVAARLANMGRGQPSVNAANGGIKREEAAKLLAVDAAGVERAKVVLARGADELQRAVDERRLTVRTAADIATLPIEQRWEKARRLMSSGTRLRPLRRALHALHHRPGGFHLVVCHLAVGGDDLDHPHNSLRRSSPRSRWERANGACDGILARRSETGSRIGRLHSGRRLRYLKSPAS